MRLVKDFQVVLILSLSKGEALGWPLIYSRYTRTALSWNSALRSSSE